MKNYRFAIGLSFSGSKRQYVAEVADILSLTFGEDKILYDLYLEAELNNIDLPTYLPKLYQDNTVINVVFFSEDYIKRDWTGLEKTVLTHWLMSDENKERLMTFTFDGTRWEQFSNAGITSCSGRKPFEIAKLIIEKYHIFIEAHILKEKRLKSKMDSVEHKRRVITTMPNVGVVVGRREELARVLEAVSQETRSWGCIIVGGGGLGKTTLAIRAAESTNEKEFEKIVFISAKEKRLLPDGIKDNSKNSLTTYLHILSEIDRQIDEFGGKTWSSRAQRIEEVLGKLSKQSVLLVIDNLEALSEGDREEIFYFLNRLPRSCKAIVTSRLAHRVEATIIELEGLSDNDSEELLDEVGIINPLLLKASLVERKKLIQKCSGNPLIMKWVLGQLGTEGCYSIESAIEKLVINNDIYNPIEYIFEKMYEDLSSNHKQVLAILVVLGEKVSAKVITELFSLSLDDVLDGLERVRKHMLVFSEVTEDITENSSFWISPLIGEFIKQIIPDKVKLIAKQYVENIHKLFIECDNRYDDFSRIDEMWPVIKNAFLYLNTLEYNNLQKFCISTKQYLSFSGHWDEWLASALIAEAKAVEKRDYDNAYNRAYNVGMVSFRRGECENVVRCAEKVLEYANNSVDSHHGIALSFRLKSIGLRGLRNYEEAIKFGEKSIELFREIGRTKNLACAINALGVTYRVINNLSKAEELCEEALQIAEEVGNIEYKCDYIGNLSDISFDLNKIEEARNRSQKSLELAEEIGRKDLIAKNHFRLAKIAVSVGKRTESYQCALCAHDIFLRLGMPESLEVKRFIDELL